MSSDRPQPGPEGEPPANDPFRKRPPASGSGTSSSPYESAPPPPGGAGGYGDHPFGQNPYGDAYGAADPLAGMPPLASRGKRLLARIIDALLISIPVFLVVGLLGGGFDTDDGVMSLSGSQIAQSLTYTAVYLVYEGYLLTTRGQTVGKMAMRIRVAMLDNGALPAGGAGWVRAAVYSLPALVPCLGTLFWLVNVLFCTWDKPYQQCLHDKIGRTVVVAA